MSESDFIFTLSDGEEASSGSDDGEFVFNARPKKDAKKGKAQAAKAGEKRRAQRQASARAGKSAAAAASESDSDGDDDSGDADAMSDFFSGGAFGGPVGSFSKPAPWDISSVAALERSRASRRAQSTLSDKVSQRLRTRRDAGAAAPPGRDDEIDGESDLDNGDDDATPKTKKNTKTLAAAAKKTKKNASDHDDSDNDGDEEEADYDMDAAADAAFDEEEAVRAADGSGVATLFKASPAPAPATTTTGADESSTAKGAPNSAKTMAERIAARRRVILSDEETSDNEAGGFGRKKNSKSGDDNDDDDDDENNDVDDVHRPQRAREREELNKKKKEQRDKAAELAAAREYGADEDIETIREGGASDFSHLNLSRPLQRAVKELGFRAPTPVQAASIPVALAGRDVLANASTGSGKTAAFMLPILERLLFKPARLACTRVLVLCPTRELAAQVHEMSLALAKYADVSIALVVGGLSLSVQMVELRQRPDIIIATPGRLIDHLRNSQSFHLEDIEILVMDEADRLLEEGFADELKEIARSCPRGRQTLLFSATLSREVRDLVKVSLHNPVRVAVDTAGSVVRTLSQEFVRIRPSREESREALVLALARRSFRARCMVFAQSKHAAHRLAILFGLVGLKCAELHGNLTQAQRLDALESFRRGEVDFLVCTDLASRGLDIQGVETVINMTMPSSLPPYVHRVGRTARAGRGGRSVTLIADAQRPLLRTLVKDAPDTIKMRTVPRAVIEKHERIIAGLEEDVAAILEEERLEKAARVADMEASKAANLIQHESDIKARPQRTWFQTTDEKKRAAAKGLAVHVAGGLAAGATTSALAAGLLPGVVLDTRASAIVDHVTGRDKTEKAPKKKKSLADQLRGLSRKERRTKLARLEMERDERDHLKMIEQAKKDGSVTPGFTARQAMERAKRQAKAEARGRAIAEDEDGELQPAAFMQRTERVPTALDGSLADDGEGEVRRAKRRFRNDNNDAGVGSMGSFAKRYSNVVGVRPANAEPAKKKFKARAGSFNSKSRYKRR